MQSFYQSIILPALCVSAHESKAGNTPWTDHQHISEIQGLEELYLKYEMFSFNITNAQSLKRV